jgi:glycosyltransferase involved in cell wall biosynthesis
MTSPLASAVVTTFNSERFLRECLDGIVAQTCPDLEIVIADNASTDRTREIARGYGARVRLLELGHSDLPGVTRNEGIRAAQGKYVALLDADDAWYPEKIARQVEFMEAHPDTPLCHTYVHIVDEQSKVLGVRHEGAIPPTGPCIRPLLRHCFISTSAAMVRRSAVVDEGLWFPADPRSDRTGEDHLFFLLFACRHPVGFIPEVLARYRRYPTSISSRFGWRIVPENMVLHENVLMHARYWEGAVPRSEPLAAFAEACLTNSVYWRDRREFGRAAYFALRALRRDPANGRVWIELLKATLKPFARKP